jgi:hypothetical protein
MSISGFRQSKRHRSVPLRERVVCQCKDTIFGVPLRLEITNSGANTGCLDHLNRVIVDSNNWIFIFSCRVIPQFPIGRRLL